MPRFKSLRVLVSELLKEPLQLIARQTIKDQPVILMMLFNFWILFFCLCVLWCYFRCYFTGGVLLPSRWLPADLSASLFQQVQTVHQNTQKKIPGYVSSRCTHTHTTQVAFTLCHLLVKATAMSLLQKLLRGVREGVKAGRRTGSGKGERGEVRVRLEEAGNEKCHN